ncbi:MAG: hypothetical protein PF518_10225 [Spirochaetaceae bacterium]|jgi:hypothetical protein|nr:hypothetical protein [Spirochaetaceae bacterium]
MNRKNEFPNIKFNYLYRDGGNYKLYDFVIFTNPKALELAEIQNRIRKNLIDGEFFSPEKWNIPSLEFETSDPELDHQWNEFESIEFTEERSEKMEAIDGFLKQIEHKSDLNKTE